MDESLFSEMYEAIDKLFSHESVSEEDIVSLQESIFTHIIPQFNEAIVLTDILGVTRNSLFNSLNNGFVEKIKTEIESKSEKLDERKQQKMWAKLMRSGHRYIHHPVMQPLIMHVMGKMTTVKEAYVSEILKSKELYEKTPMNVLRHVWLDNPEKLKEEVYQIIDSYVNSTVKSMHTQTEDAISYLVRQRKKLYGSSFMSAVPYININIKNRKMDPNIEKVAEMIGESKVMCENVMEIIYNKFEESKQLKENQMVLNSISTFRFDITSKIVDKHLSRLFEEDDWHSFIMLLGSSIREGSVSNFSAANLGIQLKEKQKLSKDLELICIDPFVLYTLAMSIISVTVDDGGNKKLPRNNSKSILLNHIMSYGLTDFESDEGIDKTTSSLRPNNLSSNLVPGLERKRKVSISDNENKRLSAEEETKHNELVENLTMHVLPLLQQTHASATREKMSAKKSKVQSSMLTRQVPDSSTFTKHAMVPTQYLSNRLGRLIIQYHCLWCLHKKDFFVLKLLLTAIYNSRRSDHRPTVEWRPELLQAIVFGICALYNSNEKMMLEFLSFIRPVIPMTTVFFQLLYLVTVAALKDLTEVDKLVDAFVKHPGTDSDITNLSSGMSMKEVLDHLKGVSREQHSVGGTNPGASPMIIGTPAYTPMHYPSQMSPMHHFPQQSLSRATSIPGTPLLENPGSPLISSPAAHIHKAFPY